MKKRHRTILSLLLGSAVLSGCASWSATSTRVQENHGQSVRHMVLDSTYSTYKTQHPAANTPEGMEGQKGSIVLQRTYQSDIGSPPRVRATPQLNISNPSGGAAQSGAP